MYPIDPIVHVLTYRNRSDLARLLNGAHYGLNESSTYGSRLFSMLTTAEVWVSIQKLDKLRKLGEQDLGTIIEAFQVIHPVRDHDIEVTWVEFFVDPVAAIPSPNRKPGKITEIDFVYITEQIAKCDNKISIADFEGAITNARNLVESICKYVLDDAGENYDRKAELPALFKQTSLFLEMHPSQHVEKSFKQILSGMSSIVQGLAAVRNELSDSHGKSKNTYYKPDERHAMLAVSTAKALADFLYSSYTERKKPTA